MEWHVLPSGRRIVICVRRNGMNKIEEIQAKLRDRQIPRGFSMIAIIGTRFLTGSLDCRNL